MPPKAQAGGRRKKPRASAPKKRVVRRRPKMQDVVINAYPNQAGGSAFTDFFTKTIPSAAASAGHWIKDNHIISRGLSMMPDPRLKAAGGVAGALGLGKKRRAATRVIRT
jgi:hypothetical protein